MIVLVFAKCKECRRQIPPASMADHTAEFCFYIPVVLWADTWPLVGMLMIPKTRAYVWTVLIGYLIGGEGRTA